MTAQCLICKTILRAREVQTLVINPSQTDLGDQPSQRALQNFDLLAGVMLDHLIKHHGDKSDELSAVIHLTSKVYAMLFADSSTPNFKQIREKWRKEIFSALLPQAAATAADEDSAPTGTDSGALPN